MIKRTDNPSDEMIMIDGRKIVTGLALDTLLPSPHPPGRYPSPLSYPRICWYSARLRLQSVAVYLLAHHDASNFLGIHIGVKVTYGLVLT